MLACTRGLDSEKMARNNLVGKKKKKAEEREEKEQ